MEVYFKAIGGALIALVLCLSLYGTGKDFALLLGALSCCMVIAVSMIYLEPVIRFFRELEEMISLDSDLLEILLKAVGIGVIGELSSLICIDSGNGALGKTVQLMTSALVLWLSLPLLQSLLDLIREIMEAI